MPAPGPCTAAVGTTVGVSVTVTFVVSFSIGVLVAYVLGYISRRSNQSSHKPSSHADPSTVHVVGINTEKRDAMAMGTKTAHEAQLSSTVHEVDTNKNMKRDAMEMNTCGTHVSSIVNDEVGSNKDMRRDAMELGAITAYGTHH